MGQTVQGLFNDALGQYRAGQLAQAEQLFQKILTIDPRHADSLHCLGAMAYQSGRHDEAAGLIGQAIRHKENEPTFHYNLGRALSTQGKFDEAAACYKRAIALNPDFAEAHSNLGSVLNEQGRLDEAVASYRRAIAVNQNLAEAYSNLGAIFYKQDRLDESVACCERALALRPDHAEAHYNLGRAFGKQGKVAEGLAHYKRAVTINRNFAEAHFSAAEALLLSGDFINGWRQYEWRWRSKDMARHGLAAPLWDGKNLEGKTIFLHCEQGLGDSIQFIRYARLVKEKQGRVLLSCPPSLVSLFAKADGIDEIITGEGKPPAYDCHAPLLSLPYLLGTTLDAIPGNIPYLRPDPAQAAVWKDRLAKHPGVKVGIAWRGRATHKNDRNRSMASADFAKFLDIPGIVIVSLQKDTAAAEIEAFKNISGSFFDAGAMLGDFGDTASLMAGLDLVITVDTSVCHLAGAVGVPVWTLLPFAPDWRWLREREDSPWYPTMRLFRQPETGDWKSVIGRVRRALAESGFIPVKL